MFRKILSRACLAVAALGSAGCAGSNTSTPPFVPVAASGAVVSKVAVHPAARSRLKGVASIALTNGQEYAAGWAPFGAASPWNAKVSANPTFLPNSDAIVASEFANGNPQPVRATEPGPYDYNYSIVYATASDPLVNLSCRGGAFPNGPCLIDGTWGSLPATIRIPANARVPGPGSGGDCVLAIVQPDGTEIDTAYGCDQGGNWTNGATFSPGAAANCGSAYGLSGETGWYGNGTGVTAGGNCVSAGLLRAVELIAGQINHALKISLQCQGPGNQFPAFPGAATDLCPSTDGGPPIGARLWYDVPAATTNGNPQLQTWEKAILNALHDYGGYFDDNSCPQGDGTGHCAVDAAGIGFAAESEEAFFDFGQANPWSQIPGWSSVPVSGTGGDHLRWFGADRWMPAGVDFKAHMHWLAPCSAQNNC